MGAVGAEKVGHTLEAFEHIQNTCKGGQGVGWWGVVGAVKAVKAVRVVRVEGVWAHIRKPENTC